MKLVWKVTTGIASSLGTLVFFILCLASFFIFHSRKAFLNVKMPEKYIEYKYFDWKSGDLILCSGNGAKVNSGPLNKIISGSQWTHVGLVFVHPFTKHVYLWDIDNVAARLIPLFAFMQRFPGQVAVRRLVQSSFTSFDQTGAVDDRKFMEFIQNYWNVPYSFEFWIHGYNRKFPFLKVPIVNHDPHGEFCCTLTAKTLEYLQVLDGSRIADADIHPEKKWHLLGIKDFENSGTLPMRHQWRFEKEILVKK
jgi:hypothetical protein